MPGMPTCEDVAVWLRFQMAAGRLSDAVDSSQIDVLARKLRVSAATVSAAYGQVCETGPEHRTQGTVHIHSNGFSAVATLVDQIVELDGFESDIVRER